MKPLNKKGTEIVLRLRDRRGHPVRAAVCDGLKLKVWTQNPRLFLTYHLRDIIQEEREDILLIPDYAMDALPPGVIIYGYSFHEGHHGETADVVVTDIKWRGGTPDGRPANPVNYETLEHIKDQMEEIDRALSKRIEHLNAYIRKEYPDKLTEEVVRATQVEMKLLGHIKDIDADLRNEIIRAGQAESVIDGKVTALDERVDSFMNLYNEGQKAESEEKEQYAALMERNLTELRNQIRDVRTAVKEKIDNLKSQWKKQVEAVKENLKSEVARAKTEEERLGEKIKTEKKRAQAAEDILEGKITDSRQRITDESERARLVEKDLAEALQKLKQNIASGNLSTEEALSALRSELIDKIDYRIKEIVGAAPEALDTLEEIATRLKQDDDALKALNEILTRKVDREDVYRKTEIESFLLSIRNLIKAEEQRAALAETRNEAAIAILNGDASTPGSVRHAEADANHYTDDAIRALRREVDATVEEVREEVLRQFTEMKALITDFFDFKESDLISQEEFNQMFQ